ncbi:hypothetical protein [Flavobacterium sp. Arc2]|jgi:hypothetical protein|uniref:hypothetical protein n=1 Tax=Flavobacterium sp. Arc2 TaxID=3046685 RepID=UPI00352E7343
MPRLDLIILPLLAGYIFLFTFNLTKFYNIRVDRQRLIFNSLLCSVLLSITAFILDYYILKSEITLFCSKPITDYRTYFSILTNNIIGKNNIVFGFKHSILILFISFPLAKFLNLFCSRKFAYDFTIRKFGTQLDRLFWFSLTEKKDEDKLLMITTKSNKVYIGYVNKISEPLGESHIRIIPNFSGYRDKEKLTIDITTKYTDVIKFYVENNKKKEIDEKLGIIIPTSEILIVSKFDADIFGRLNLNDNLDEITETNTQKIFRNLSNLLKDLTR